MTNPTKLIRYILLFTYIFISTTASSQVVKSIMLDSVVVAAVKKGFSVEDFIEMVKADTSFLKAFRYLRNSQHEVTGNMIIYGRKKKVSATRYSHATQITNNKRRWIKMDKENVAGKFYNRKDEPDSYTAELFDDIFFYTDTLPVLSPSVSISATTNTNNSGNVNKLKKLVFNPGSEINGVPIIGKRMAIFDDEMVNFYDYSIRVASFNDSIPCYVFSCKLKFDDGDFPVKYLNTWFDRKTFNIVYRDYKLQYTALFFDFDVDMKIKMDYVNDILYPSHIEYSGFWNIPLRKKETVDFELLFKLLPEN